MYSALTWKHMQDPQNRGVLKNPDAVGEAHYPPCGDHFILQLQVQEGRIVQAKFLAKACGPVVAVGSAATTMLESLTLEQARNVSAFQLDQLLGGLPLPKRHALLLFLDSLHQAIEQYSKENYQNVDHQC